MCSLVIAEPWKFDISVLESAETIAASARHVTISSEGVDATAREVCGQTCDANVIVETCHHVCL